MKVLRYLAPALAAATALCCFSGRGPGVQPCGPTAGNGFTVSLAASGTDPYVGTAVTLTATANTDVGPTPYYITIYDETTAPNWPSAAPGSPARPRSAGARWAVSSSGRSSATTCPAPAHPGFVLVSSNQVTAMWWRFVIIGRLSPVAG